jgi:predicted ATP-grasp superfamily ATP-dependent carboligase
MYCDVLGLPLPANRVQKYKGVKWIYLQHDIPSAVHYWKRGELTIRDWGRSIRGVKWDAVFSWSDPAPFWYGIGKSFKVLITPKKAS